MTAHQEQAAATDRLRRALLAFQTAQSLLVQDNRRLKGLVAETVNVQAAAAKVVAAFKIFSAAGLIPSAEDRHRVNGAAAFAEEQGNIRPTPNDTGAADAERRAGVNAEAEARRYWEERAEPRNAFVPVAEAYSRQFHKEIWTRSMDPARYPALIAAMQAAIVADYPLSVDEAAAITGILPPPLDAIG